MRIGIDLMGSDTSPHILFEAVLQAAQPVQSHNATLLVIATHSIVSEIKAKHLSILSELGPNRIEFFSVADAIAMSDDPLFAASHKKSSSLVVGIRLLKKQRLDAFVSAGNTGALIASTTLQLPRLPGIQRPALLVLLPTLTGSVAVLDVGGSVALKAHHLVQFANLGAAYQSCRLGIDKPAVGLLNIGVEPKKGTSAVRQAYQTLSDQALPSSQSMQFLGNMEARDLFKGGIDVLVTDGFAGNVLLKTTEGVSSFIFDYIKKTLRDAETGVLKPELLDLERHFKYDEYPGAVVCGVEGLVIKCHGHSSAKAMFSGIMGAIDLVNKQLIPKMKARLTPPSI